MDLTNFLRENWAWAAGLAAAIYSLMFLAEELIASRRKETISLWLMGAENEETWARSFCGFVDALFGARHLSPHCVLRSAAASLIAVCVIW
ncbi:hypothetical protein, partial [Rhodovulum sulfidophilum]|uniref:hypothetical protein n=1 Tax=Rhodovulum sulfidophilum TaxID=35806 RepID=UPI001389D9DA